MQDVVRAVIQHQTLSLENNSAEVDRQQLDDLLALGKDVLLIEAGLVVERINRSMQAAAISGSPSDMLRTAGAGANPDLVNACVRLCELVSARDKAGERYKSVQTLVEQDDGGLGALALLVTFAARAGQFALTVDPHVNSWPELIQAEAIKLERDYAARTPPAGPDHSS